MEIVSTQRVDPTQVYSLIKKDIAGSVVLHFAIVRGSSENRITSSIEFRPTGETKEIDKELRTISNEIRKKWQIEDMVVIRVLGRLNVCDIISLVGVSSPHKEEAFEACRYGVDRLKGMTTIIKNEAFM
jgi:molybdopterin synthase catalytic subunit